MTGGPAELIVSAAACALTSASAIETSADGRLLIADVASLDCIAPHRRAELGALVVARLDGFNISLSRQALANLVRRRAPAVTVVLGGQEHDAIAIRRERRAPPALALCAEALVPIGADEPLTAANVGTTACTASAPLSPAVGYNRADGIARARTAIATGDDLGRLMLFAPLAVDAGQELTLQVQMGAARIERTVEAMQASTGGAVFVRDADGQVFSAPLPAPALP